LNQKSILSPPTMSTPARQGAPVTEFRSPGKLGPRFAKATRKGRRLAPSPPAASFARMIGFAGRRIPQRDYRYDLRKAALLQGEVDQQDTSAKGDR
jgi:hypothetical protein